MNVHSDEAEYAPLGGSLIDAWYSYRKIPVT